MTSATHRKNSTKIGLKRPSLGLRAIHEDGSRILEMLPKRGAGESLHAAILELAKKTKLNSAELWTRVRFAEMYNERALGALLKFEHLTWSHARKLLTVDDPDERRSFARKADIQRWSPRRMLCEIEARQGVKRSGGRPKNSIVLTPGTLHLLKQDVRRMCRLLKAFNLAEPQIPEFEKEELSLFKERVLDVVEELNQLRADLPNFVSNLEKARHSLRRHCKPTI